MSGYYPVLTKPRVQRKPGPRRHDPATDAEAQAIILRLGTNTWDTHKTTGQFTHHPYRITAVVDGVHHTIHLPGRYGSTLTWLKRRLDAEQGHGRA